jgi:NAD(P)-dependent dehydrogenase (short-subunit alcohol dehydrogenase family)
MQTFITAPADGRAGRKRPLGYGHGSADMNLYFPMRRRGPELGTGTPAVEFLATDLSDYVTGAMIPIDSGLVRG